MSHRFRSVVPAVLLVLLSSGAVAMAAEPSGTITWGVHVTLATRWLDTAETDAEITPFMVLYALHDALVKPMPGGLVGATGAAGNASTRIEPYATGRGVNSYGTPPGDREPLPASARRDGPEEAGRHAVSDQRLIAERVMFVPIWENGFIRAYGSRVEEPGLTLIPAFPLFGTARRRSLEEIVRGSVLTSAASAL